MADKRAVQCGNQMLDCDFRQTDRQTDSDRQRCFDVLLSSAYKPTRQGERETDRDRHRDRERERS